MTLREKDIQRLRRIFGSWERLARALYRPLSLPEERFLTSSLPKRGCSTPYDLDWFLMTKLEIEQKKKTRPSLTTKKALQLLLDPPLGPGSRLTTRQRERAYKRFMQAYKHYSQFNKRLKLLQSKQATLGAEHCLEFKGLMEFDVSRL